VRGGREVERLHGGLLGLADLLAGGEGALQGGVDHRVLEQIVGEPADRVLGLRGDPGPQAGRLLSGGAVGVVWAAHICGPPWTSAAGLGQTSNSPARVVSAEAPKSSQKLST